MFINISPEIQSFYIFYEFQEMSRKSLENYSKKTRSNALKRLKIELAELSFAPMPEFEASPVSEVIISTQTNFSHNLRKISSNGMRIFTDRQILHIKTEFSNSI